MVERTQAERLDVFLDRFDKVTGQFYRCSVLGSSVASVAQNAINFRDPSNTSLLPVVDNLSKAGGAASAIRVIPRFGMTVRLFFVVEEGKSLLDKLTQIVLEIVHLFARALGAILWLREVQLVKLSPKDAQWMGHATVAGYAIVTSGCLAKDSYDLATALSKDKPDDEDVQEKIRDVINDVGSLIAFPWESGLLRLTGAADPRLALAGSICCVVSSAFSLANAWYFSKT